MGDHLLVFGDDGSPDADVAWGWVVSQRWPAWTVRVVTVVSPSVGSPESLRATKPEARPRARRASEATGIEAVESLVVTGDPGSGLIGAGAATLIVIGSRRTGGADRLGLTTQHLVGHLRPPLVIAKQSGPVRRVVVAVDGSHDAHAAACWLARMPWVDEVEAVEVLGVHEERRNVERGLEEALGALLEAGVPARRAIAEGAVAHAICAEAERFRADLVTLGVRGLNPMHRLGIGSTAKSVARSSACGVLLAADHAAESS